MSDEYPYGRGSCRSTTRPSPPPPAFRQAGFEPEALPHFDHEFLDLALEGVRHDFDAQTILDDRSIRGYSVPARDWFESRVARPEALRREAAGLVSVPTSLQTPLSRPLGGRDAVGSAEAAAVASVELRGALDGFPLDSASRRLSRLRMIVGHAARAHAVSQKGHRSDVPWMVTLTYRPGVQWRSDHLSEALQKCRHWTRKKGFAFRYVWIGETQDGERRADGVGRGVIHYHVVLWLPVGVRAPHFDSRGWWPHGMTRKDPPPSTRVANPVGYLLHYLKKDKDLSRMPKGARAYGVGGLDLSLRRCARWLRLPRFVQGNSSINDNWRRADGGGWIAPNGDGFCSEFRTVFISGIRCAVRICTHSVAIDASGAFSWLSDRPRGLSQ